MGNVNGVWAMEVEGWARSMTRRCVRLTALGNGSSIR